MDSTVQAVLEEYSSKIESSAIFFAPNLPPKKVENALISYAFTAKNEQILALVDNTVFGSARKGILLTDESIYTCGTMETAKSIKLSDVQSVALTRGSMPELRINDIEFVTFTIGEKEAPRLFAEMLEKISKVYGTQERTNLSVSEQPIAALRISSDVREILKEYSSAIEDDHIFFAPNLPPKKVGNAIRSYASPAKDEAPLVLIDDTVFGNAKVGVLLTDKSIYSHIQMESPQCLDLRSIQSVAFKKGLLSSTIRINGTTFAKCDTPGKKAMCLFSEMLEKISKSYGTQEGTNLSVGEQPITALRWIYKGELPIKLCKILGTKYSGRSPYAPPALVVFGGKLHMVRRGPGRALLHSTYDGIQWSPDHEIRHQESDWTPVLATAGDVLHMVHRGQSLANIWHSTYDGVSWSHNETIPGQEPRGTLALAGVGDVLHMLYQGPKGRIYHSTFDDQEWSVGMPLNKISKFCPRLAVSREVLHMLYVAGSEDSIWCSTFAGQEWSPSVKIPEQKCGVPTVAAVGGVLHVLCKGSKGHVYHFTYDGQGWSSRVRERVLEKHAGTNLVVAAGGNVLHVMFTTGVSNRIRYFQGIGEPE